MLKAIRTDPALPDPLEDRLLIRRDEAEQITAGGVVIPDNARRDLTRGVVLAAGPGKFVPEWNQRQDMVVQTGDHVAFERWAGAHIRVGDEDLIVIRESEVLAIYPSE